MTANKAPGSARAVAVFGLGTMGHGITQVCAMAGCPTRGFDCDPAVRASVRQRIEKNLQGAVARGKLTEQGLKDTLARIEICDSFENAAQNAHLVIESVPEQIGLKREVLARAATINPGAVMATNTSSLPIGDLGQDTGFAERLIGLHFFNPAHIMKLLEIVVGTATSDSIVTDMQAFAQRLNKEAVTVKDSPGFASSRLGIAIGLEAIRMLEEGVASAEDIDRAMQLGYGFPVGPLRLSDIVGLDVRLEIADYLAQALPQGRERFAAPQLLRDMVAQGKLGKKSGEGFYRW